MIETKRRCAAGSGLVFTIVGLALATGWLVTACGEGGSQSGASEGGAAAERPSLPPIDLAAPRSFQTASFAFG